MTQADYQTTYKTLSCNSSTSAMACNETTISYLPNDKGITMYYYYVQNQTYNCVNMFAGLEKKCVGFGDTNLKITI